MPATFSLAVGVGRLRVGSSRLTAQHSTADRHPATRGVAPALSDGKLIARQSPCSESTAARAGVEASREAAFVLVAGGLGERLGYSGIKIALPTDLARDACFLQVLPSTRSVLPSNSLRMPQVHA